MLSWSASGFTFQDTDTWHQVGLIRQSGADYFYLDGLPVSIQQVGTPSPPTDFCIGTLLGSDQLNAVFNGFIDDVRIYNRALADFEIQQLFTFEATNIQGQPIGVTNAAATYRTLYSFSGSSDGANPQASLMLSSGTLYGTAQLGGSEGAGSLFAVKNDGTGFTNLHSFTFGSAGAYQSAGLILSSNILYGTASQGGSGDANQGMVYKLNADGSGFTILHSFTLGDYNTFTRDVTNSDGDSPQSGLVLSDNTLYGTASGGCR